jgi:hypothetical protein
MSINEQSRKARVESLIVLGFGEWRMKRVVSLLLNSQMDADYSSGIRVHTGTVIP